LILLAAKFCNTLIRSISVRLIAITVIGPNSPTKTVESDISIWANGDFSIWRLQRLSPPFREVTIWAIWKCHSVGNRIAAFLWVNADTVDRVLTHLMSEGLKVEDGDRIGKTIIFAKNHKHADFIAQRFDASYPHLAGHFARVITHDVSYAQSLIDDFSDPAKAPTRQSDGSQRVSAELEHISNSGGVREAKDMLMVLGDIRACCTLL
jgi:hypothetical protein